MSFVQRLANTKRVFKIYLHRYICNHIFPYVPEINTNLREFTSELCFKLPRELCFSDEQKNKKLGRSIARGETLAAQRRSDWTETP